MQDEKVYLRYYTQSGLQETVRISPKTSEVILKRRGIVSIDLTPLTECKNLQFIDLSENNLEMLDLNPLCALEILERIDLRHNQIKALNLTPIAFCEILSTFLFDKTTVLRIEPAAYYAKGNNALTSILKQMKQLVRYEEIVEVFGWRTVLLNTRELLRLLPERQWFAAQFGLLSGLGLQNIAGYDGPPDDILEKVNDLMSFSRAVDVIQEHVLKLLHRQLREGGSSHFININSLMGTEAAIIVPDLLENRRNEMEGLRLRLMDDEGRVDGRVLWFTHYGREILSSIKSSSYLVDNETLQQILQVLRSVGLEPEFVSSEFFDNAWDIHSIGLRTFLEGLSEGRTFVIERIQASSEGPIVESHEIIS
ncbi:MAG: hypothetical protein ACFFED_15590 [Candidatus Thorarchaeota archaeon]